jgi:hypothetical protein
MARAPEQFLGLKGRRGQINYGGTRSQKILLKALIIHQKALSLEYAVASQRGFSYLTAIYYLRIGGEAGLKVDGLQKIG